MSKRYILIIPNTICRDKLVGCFRNIMFNRETEILEHFQRIESYDFVRCLSAVPIPAFYIKRDTIEIVKLILFLCDVHSSGNRDGVYILS